MNDRVGERVAPGLGIPVIFLSVLIITEGLRLAGEG